MVGRDKAMMVVMMMMMMAALLLLGLVMLEHRGALETDVARQNGGGG